jgi:hypothetical protein
VRRRAIELCRNLFLLSCAICCVGCGSGDSGRVAVGGKVAFNGQPIEQGTIIFEPSDGGRMSVGEIDNGSYNIPRDRGPTAGAYIVRITANRPTGKKLKAAVYADDQTPVDVFEQFIPVKFNQSSSLAVDIEPTAGATYDFALDTGIAK